MKRFLLLTLPILILIIAGFAAITYVQDRVERARLLDELHRKAKAVAESSEDLTAEALMNLEVS